ncbi:EamA family transporter [Paenibacillus aurantius]|uniref:EamA family transporter n=1 Tax=Paenibacillus aurantius TaxID=2918900 RepID=A0AA96RGZ1_9BACL|nr:EamA family transporter [Paenibacillus aurantius]WJH33109.1 EamA family transporter [Paenibacillus sp. CC-CFT747]WNQ13557.1 EamA family transporter [Paenibacillus aurantius]
MAILLIVLANVILLVTGQLLWKVALSRHPLKSVHDLIPIFLQPSMLVGCFLFAAATLIWFYALSKYDLSRVYPLQSMAYVMGAISGILFFRETMSGGQWIGLLLIVGGAFLIARS